MPKLFVQGSPVWLWLGSDNNVGRKTEWKQGIRALAVCAEKSEPEPGSFVITLDDVFILPETIERAELLEISPETYANNLINATIVGLNNYASQVVQLLEPEEFATIAALIAKMLPSAADELFARVDGADEVVVIPRQADLSSPPPSPIAIYDDVDDNEPDLSELDDDDPIFREVVQLVVNDGMGGALLLGAPGTGKSWYARQIAKKLVGGDRKHFREIQFHPSYQYEDFVEGYVPDSKRGFRQVDKHLLQMVEIAKNSDGLVVLVIDEFSRTDPARVMGEAMTYMEGSLRGVSFSLPSGRRTDIPRNLVFLATMNPDDRSVDEIDAAMDRRWAKLVIAELKKAGCSRVYSEQVSSVDADRPQLRAALGFLRDGDTFVVTRPDRLARGTMELLTIVDDLTKQGVGVRIMSMDLDTTTATGRLVLTVLAGIATFERSLMLERQRAGIAKAKALGKYRGRAPTARAKSAEILSLKAQGNGVAEIVRQTGASRASVYRILQAG